MKSGAPVPPRQERQLLREVEFSFEGRNLAVRAVVEDNEVKVRVFDGQRRVTNIVYSVTVETAFDAALSGFPLNIVDDLMALAERDVRNGTARIAA